MISLLTGSALWSAFGSGWAGRAAGHLLSDVEAAWKWLAADLWRLVAAVVLIAWGIDHVSCHRHAAHLQAQLASTTKALTDLRAQLDAAAAKIRAQDAQNAAMANQLRKANDEEHSRNSADAADLRVSGPGRAACRPVAPASPDGHDQAPAKPDASGPALPPDDSAAVPWNWLVDRAQEHDDLLANEKAWRQWYDNLVKAWPKQ